MDIQGHEIDDFLERMVSETFSDFKGIKANPFSLPV